MGIFARAVAPSRATPAPRAAVPGPVSMEEVPRWMSGGPTRSGVSVSAETAMRCAAVYSCVRVVSEDVAKVPLILYRDTEEGGRERAKQHSLYWILNRRPNSWLTSFEFREMMQAHLELRGNAYAYITRAGPRNEVRELIPIHPDRMTVRQREDMTLEYRWKGRPVETEKILHFRGLTLDGVNGVSTITYARETIGLAVAAERHSAALYGNGARPGLVVEHPTELSEPAFKRMKSEIETATSGDNAFRLLLLEEGTKLSSSPVSMTMEDAQFIETLRFKRSEIAGLFRVPPHKIGDLEKATFSNIEHQGQDYLDSALDPRLVRMEQRMWCSLLTEEEQRTHTIEFLRVGLLRGDNKSRAEYYASAINNTWMMPNEARVAENMNPVPGLDEFRRPANMEPVNASRS